MSLRKDLIGYWTMDSRDIDNGFIRDQSAFDHIAGLEDVTTGEESVLGEAIGFNGDKWVDITGGLPNLGGEYTISFWCFHQGEGEGTQSLIEYYENNRGAIRDRGDGSLSITHWDANGENWSWSTDEVISYDEWIHWTIKLEDQKFRVYRNGELVDTENSPDDMDNYNDSDRLGSRGHRSPPDDTFEGKLSEVRIYKRALSQGEINKLYMIRSPRRDFVNYPATPGVIAWYDASRMKLNDGDKVVRWPNLIPGSEFGDAVHSQGDPPTFDKDGLNGVSAIASDADGNLETQYFPDESVWGDGGSILVVMKVTGLDDSRQGYISTGWNSGARTYMVEESEGAHEVQFGMGDSFDDNTNYSFDTDKVIIMGVYADGGDCNWEVYEEGEGLVESGTFGYSWGGTNDDPLAFFGGVEADYGRAKIGEIIFYDENLYEKGQWTSEVERLRRKFNL